MIKKVKIPNKHNTPDEKYKWAVKADKTLLDLHNWMGEWYRLGKTQQEYNTLPQKIKDMFPYKEKITLGEFERFRTWHHSATIKVHGEMHKAKPSQPMPQGWKPGDVNPDMDAKQALRQSAFADNNLDVNIDRDLE